MEWIAVRWLVLTVSILATAAMFDGIHVESIAAALGAAALLGILNTCMRPLLLILTLPVTILSFGIFALVINAVLLLMTAGMISGFHVDGFGVAFFGSLVISIVNLALTGLRFERGKVSVIDLKQKNGRWG